MNNFVVETIFFLLPSDRSLYSAIVALYTLLLLYSPGFLFRFIFSPVLTATLVLLLYLLRFFAAPSPLEQINLESESGLLENGRNVVGWDSDLDTRTSDPNSNSNSNLDRFFVEWDVRAPLEVIYEEYGEGEDGNDTVLEGVDVIQRYASLALFYPESDGDSSSEGIFPEDLIFRWEEEEDEREGLIEIELEMKRDCDYVDEENLIEIDLY